jgi:hypothetical protein
MTDWVKVISIVSVAVVTIVAFGLGVSTDIQSKLVYGLLIITGGYMTGAGLKFLVNKLQQGRNNNG